MFICYLLRSLRAKRLKKRVLGIKQDLVSEPLETQLPTTSRNVTLNPASDVLEIAR